VVCLYDKVDEEFLYGSGTENFIAGGVVNVWIKNIFRTN
jgi:hypothetical protein